MQLRALRRVLQQVVVAGLPLTAVACTDGDGGWIVEEHTDDCNTRVKRRFEVATPAEAAMQFRIDACRLDADACFELCAFAMERAEVGHAPAECDVRFTASEAIVDVTYSYWSGGPSCDGTEGRRPAGLAMPAAPFGSDPIGAWLAQAAWLEAASVYAFAQLARELDAHGAPRKLVRWAIAAAREEVHHVQLMTQLALRHGARPPRPEVQLPPVRSLEAIALENAAEGCVRETFAAALALWQSRTAHDPHVRATFAVIAEDEARHAALAWAVDAWLAPQLDAGARARVLAMRTATATALAAEQANATMDPRAAAVLGLPLSGHAQALVARTRASLWGGLS